MYEVTFDFAQVDQPRPPRRAAPRGGRQHQQAMDDFVSVQAATLPIGSPENIGRIMTTQGAPTS